jgi:predicted ATPase
LREVEWRPDRLNVLIGPNASGKSNLLRAMALLQKSAQGELSQEILRMGGIAPLLWDGQTQELAWSVTTDPLGDTTDPLTYELTLRQLGLGSVYRVEHELLAHYPEMGDKQARQTFVERRPGYAGISNSADPSMAVPIDRIPDEQTLLSFISGPFGIPIAVAFRASLAGWAIYHDMHVDQKAPLRQAAVTRFEQRVAPDGQNLIPVLHTLYTGSRDFKTTLDEAMLAAFGKEYEELVFPPAADQRIQMRIRWRSLRTEQSTANLSDGTIRFLLLVAILASPDPGPLIAIDEPEMGLHPSMLPVLVELAADAAERTQVVFTTHSAQFLDAFKGEPPTTTIAHWADGATQLTTVDGEELRRWLSEYSLGALFRSGELEGMAL